MGNLVLCRKRGEKITIGEGTIIITVIDVHGGVVRIGVKAATDIPVHRTEVQDRIHQAELLAKQTEPTQ